jgi:virginiamycin B lyase
MKCLALGLLFAVAGNLFAADVRGGAVPGAREVIEGKVFQWSVPLAQTARDPAADTDGNIYFAIAKGDRIARFDIRSHQFKEWELPPGTLPHGVAIARDGKVYFAGKGSGVLGELDTATGAVRRHPGSDASSGPYSVALDGDGNVWMTEREAGRLARFDPASGKVASYPMDGEPYGLAIDRRGVVWVTRIRADTVSSFDPRTGKTTELHTGTGSKPRRLALAPDGYLWVSLYGTGKLVKIDTASGRMVKEYPLPEGSNSGPYSVNVDALGRVWVALFQKDSVAILDPTRETFRVIRLPDRNSGIRNATIDGKGRYWFVATGTGKLGVIE